MQCSLRIGEILYHLLNKLDLNHSVDLINKLTENPTQASLFAVGNIISHINTVTEAILSSLLTSLLRQSEDLIFPTLYALTQCFKVYQSGISNFVEPSFKLATESLNSEKEEIQLIAIQLVISLVETRQLQKEAYIQFVDLALQKHQSPFVSETACRLLARFSFSLINSEKEEDSLKEALLTVLHFKSHKEIVFSHFLAMLDTDFIDRHYPLIAGFIVDHCPVFFNLFTNLLSKENKKDLYELFEKTDEDNLPKLSVLENLDFDDKTRFNIAALAYDLVVCKNVNLRAKGAEFFLSLYSKDRELAVRFLQSALLFLSDPPEGYPELYRNIKSKALIASNIISSVDNKEMVLKGSEEYISQFLERSFECAELLKGEFASAFVLMSSLPTEYVPIESVYKALVRFRKFFKGTEMSTAQMKKESLYLGSSVMCFIAAHPYVSKADKTIQLILSNRSLLTHSANLGAFLSFPHIQAAPSVLNAISAKLRPEILSICPSIEYMQYRTKNPMIGKTELLHGSLFVMPSFPAAFVTLNEEDVAIRVVENYSEYIKHIPKETIPNEISFLFKEETDKTVSILLLNSLIRDKETVVYMPSDIVEHLFRLFEDHKNVPRIQLISESLALYAQSFPSAVHTILKKTANWRNHKKCLIYAALFEFAPIGDETVIQMMLELNSLAKVEELTPFSLFALSVLYQTQFAVLTSLKMTDDQCTFLLDILQSPLSLNPFNLYFISQVFNALLPILSAELSTTRSDIVPIVIETLKSFSRTKISFAHQVWYMTLRTASQLGADLIKSVSIKFPDNRFKSIATRLNTYGVFADLLNFNLVDNAFFDKIPEALVMLQVSRDSRTEDFIRSVAHNFASNSLAKCKNCDENDKSEIQTQFCNWISLIYDILVNSYIPMLTGGAKVEARNTIKKCMLSVANVFVPYIKTSDNCTEMTEKIVQCACSCVSRHEQILYKESFTLLSSVIQYLDCTKFLDDIAVAADKGFSSLDLTAFFHVKFLDFIAPLIKSDEKYISCLSKFIKGIDRVLYVPFSFFTISLKILELARESEAVMKVLMPYSNQLLELLSDKVIDLMSLFDDNKEIADKSDLGNLYYSWSRFVGSFVWLETITTEKITHDCLISFFNDEISRSEENWRLSASLNGLIAVYSLITCEESLISETVDAIIASKTKLAQKENSLLKNLVSILKEKTRVQKDIELLSSI